MSVFAAGLIALGALVIAFCAGVLLAGYLGELSRRRHSEANLAASQAVITDVTYKFTEAQAESAGLRAERDGLADQLTPLRADVLKLGEEIAVARGQLANYERSKGTLHSESMEDLRARELRAADSAAVGVEHMLNAIRILAPERLRKTKGR